MGGLVRAGGSEDGDPAVSWRLIEPKALGLGRVYFVADDDRGAVKIGFTARCPIERVKTLQVGNPCPVRYLASYVGTVDDERDMHEKFSGARIRGEWFEAVGDLADTINECARAEAGSLPTENETSDRALQYLSVL